MNTQVKLIKDGEKSLLVFPDEISEKFGFNEETIVDLTIKDGKLHIVPVRDKKDNHAIK